jgi:hypothetical protein
MTLPPGRRAGHQHTAWAGLAALALACATAGAPSLPETPAPAGLRVRLAFGPEADLDLHVTDPRQETVYFANTPSASGGHLVSDVRCGAPGERVEVIEFEAPPAGRYRVSVDFPVRCRRGVDAAHYVLEVEANGLRREQRGTLAFGRFEPVVYEFQVGGD